MKMVDDVLYWIIMIFIGLLFLGLVCVLVWSAYISRQEQKQDRELRRQLDAHERPFDWAVDGDGEYDEDYPLSGVRILDRVPEEWAEQWQ